MILTQSRYLIKIGAIKIIAVSNYFVNGNMLSNLIKD